MVDIINSLASAADAYIATAKDDPTKDLLFEAVEQWMAASFEADGYTEAELERMDIKSASQEYIDRRRAAKL